MNIFFERIRYKNLLSTGNLFTELDLSSNRMTLIIGENGAGKSTLLDALCFVLFNKPFRNINKPQLLNTITKKDMVVEVEFKIKGVLYKVVRGMKPNIFEIWKNGELITQDSASRDYQAHLEKNILRTNHKTFCQIVILGSASFVPFMQLPKGQRREITEDLLDLQIFTTMNSLLKEKLSSEERKIKDIETRVAIAERELSLMRKHAQEMVDEKDKLIEEKQQKLDVLVKDRETSHSAVSELMKKVSEFTTEIADKQKTEKKASSIKKIEAQLSAKIDALDREIKFLCNNENCPTCKQRIDALFAHEVTEEKSKSIAETKEGMSLLKEEWKAVQTRLDEIEAINKMVSDLNMEIYVTNTKIAGWETQIKDLNKEIAVLQEHKASLVDESALKELEDKFDALNKEKFEASADLTMMNYISVLLKDSGIKARIIKQYIPIINKLINKYLAALDFFVDFHLDESFEETIKSRHRDAFAYNSFSEGEKMRIDLAVLFAWRAVSKLRSSVNTNLLIMDEVFDSSLDASGTEEFMKILTKVTEDNNVFIISHKTDQLWDKFEHVIRFEKVKNFSRMSA